MCFMVNKENGSWTGALGSLEASEDKPSRPARVWNSIPDEVRERIAAMALECAGLSPRELACAARQRLSLLWEFRRRAGRENSLPVVSGPRHR